MTEKPDSPPHQDRVLFKVRGPRDFYGGLALVALAALALWAAGDLAEQEGFTFGAGTAPRLFAIALGAIGLLIMANGVLFDGPPLEGFAVRGPAFVVWAIFFFAVTIRGFDFQVFRLPALGLIPSTFCAFMISVFGSREMRPIESLLAAAVMTFFCVVLFVYLLELPFQLWPEL